MANKKELKEKLLALSQQQRLYTTVGAYLNKSLEKHLQRLKYIDSPICTKKKWVEQAIKEELGTDLEFDESFQNGQLILHLPPECLESLKNRVKTIRKFKRSYSNKKFVEEAIYKKLEREEQKTRELLEEKLRSC